MKGCCSLSYSALKEIFFSNFIAGFAVKDAAVSLIQHLKVLHKIGGRLELSEVVRDKELNMEQVDIRYYN